MHLGAHDDNHRGCEAVLRGLRSWEGMGRLQNVLQNRCDILRTGRAAGRVKTLQQYTDWMKGLLTFMPDGRYELRSFGTDDVRKSVCAYGVFYATHTGQGGPCLPTRKSVKTDYVYVMEFEGDKIRHLTKIWHSGLAMKQLGWA
jgi:hypothetical protein